MTSSSPSAGATVPVAPATAAAAEARGAAVVADRAWFQVLDATVSITIERRAWADEVRDLLAPFLVPAGASGAGEPGIATALVIHDRARAGSRDAVLVAAGFEVARGPWPAVLARLLVEVNALALRSYAGLAVHAGVVARGDAAVCFPGESGLGKSTMTAACLRAGFDYVSDEALCIERASGDLIPYPRPLALSLASSALVGLAPEPGTAPPPDDHGREVLVRPEHLGARSVAPGADRPLRLAHVVELRRGASEAHLEPLHRSLAVPALLSMAFNHYEDADGSVELVGALAGEVRMWRLHHEDPVEAASLLARALPWPS